MIRDEIIETIKKCTLGDLSKKVLTELVRSEQYCMARTFAYGCYVLDPDALEVLELIKNACIHYKIADSCDTIKEILSK